MSEIQEVIENAEKTLGEMRKIILEQDKKINDLIEIIRELQKGGVNRG